MSGFNAAHTAALDAAARQRHRQQFLGMNAYDRHKRMVHDLVTYYGGNLPSESEASLTNLPSTIKTDLDVLKESYRFIRSQHDDDAAGDSWEVRLAKRYYSRLFKEYAIADLSQYQQGKLGMRWRTQKEVIRGKGQFMCGATGCEERRGLASFEVPFGYMEAGEKKQALVKVRVCPEHAYQLNYKKHKQAEAAAAVAAVAAAGKRTKQKKEDKRKHKKRRMSLTDSDATNSDKESDESAKSADSDRKDKKRRKSSSKRDESKERHKKKRQVTDDRTTTASDDEGHMGRKKASHQYQAEQRHAETAGGAAIRNEDDEFFKGLFE